MPLDPRAVRAQLPVLGPTAYLNTGSVGPLPLVAAEAIARWAAAAPAAERGALAGFGAVEAEARALRAAAGRVVGAPPERIALTQNTTQGVNLAAWGIDWRPGDEIVTVAYEHPGLAVPLAVLARRAGARVRVLDAEATAGDLEEAVGRVTGPRTRMVALSHVSWATGAVLDVEGAARAARAAGALVVVDGAQAAGAISVDPVALGADAYAFPAHKWLLGPEGLGALWVSEAAMGPAAPGRAAIDITIAGLESGTHHEGDGAMRPHPSARRYEHSTLPAALLPGWRASLEWLEGLGWPAVHAGTRAAQSAARAALEAIPGVRVLTPPGPQAGLVTFTVAGRAPEAAARELSEAGVTVRSLPMPAALRASVGFFTDEGDIARLAAGVAAVSSC